MNTSKDWVDFRLIKETVSMKDLLDRYSIDWLKTSGEELRGKCPIHKGDGDRSFHVNLTKNAFNCFSCKARGNVLDFVAAMEASTVREAAIKIRDWFAVGEEGALQKAITKSAPVVAKATEETIINPPLSFQLRIDHLHAYGINRGLTKETIEFFGAGFCLSKGTFAGRYVVPLHNEVGELVGYLGRSLDETEPKYLFPSKDRGFRKSRLLFNLHRVEKSAEQIILVEGCFACIHLWQVGFPSLALLGSTLSKEQEEMLITRFEKVLLLFDGDTAGKKATDDCLLRIGRKLWVKALSLPEGKQPDDLTAEAIAELVASAR
jgi:DNA primase